MKIKYTETSFGGENLRIHTRKKMFYLSTFLIRKGTKNYTLKLF